jgi:hypothetical protein
MTTTTIKTQDEQYLQILSIFHYIVGAMAGLFACFPIFHFVMGIAFMAAGVSGSAESGGAPAALFGLMFTVIAGSIILFGWAFAICTALTGRYLTQRRRYMFCLVMAGVECIFTPFGTVLGVFTIIVLMRPEVKAMFGVETAPSAPAL